MSEYLFCGLVGAVLVALSVALTGLSYLFKHLSNKHKVNKRNAEYKRLKRFQRKANQFSQYAQFVALAESVKK